MWPKSSTLHGVHQLISFSQLSLTAAGPVSAPSAGSNQSDVHPGLHTTHPLVTFCVGNSPQSALCIRAHLTVIIISSCAGDRLVVNFLLFSLWWFFSSFEAMWGMCVRIWLTWYAPQKRITSGTCGVRCYCGALTCTPRKIVTGYTVNYMH